MADVHHFVVNCADTWDSIRNEPWGAISAPGLKKLRALQKPIYECEKEKASNGRVVRVRAGKRI